MAAPWLQVKDVRAEAAAELESACAQAAALGAQLEEATSAAKASRAAAASLEQQLDDANQQLSAAAEELRAAKSGAAEAGAALDASRTRCSELEAALEAVKQQAAEEGSHAAAEREALQRHLDKARLALSGAEAAAAEAGSEVENKSALIASLQEQLEQVWQGTSFMHQFEVA